MRIFGEETSRASERIAQARQATPNPGFPWYPYDSITNLVHLKQLLGSEAAENRLMEAAREVGVLDIGCGDGDLAFLFESLGCRVDAVDHPIPNHNGMQGIRRLKQVLQSEVRIHEIDLDSQFSVPEPRYGLAVFLGLLYHLKNPLYVLEHLARHANYCLLSTRVARRLPDGTPIPEGHPLAYLVDADELNHDNSNFWIFSNAGLRRALKRTQWEVVEWLSVGDTESSDPVSVKHDERAFCLLRSHHAMMHVELLSGWHEAEASGWRWTQRRFSARFEAGRATRLELVLYLSPEVFDHLGAMTLSIRINGVRMAPALLTSPGEHTVARELPTHSGSAIAEFELDKALPPSPAESRELGIVVARLEVDRHS